MTDVTMTLKNAERAASWFPYRVRRENAALRLLCFPHAGGAASSFHGWSTQLPSWVEVCSAQLPGRERRLSEAHFTSLSALVDVLVEVLQPLLDRPFAVFGHSLGAHIAFALSGRLRALGLRQPVHLFVAAAIAPHLRTQRAPVVTMSDADLIRELVQLGGVPRPVLNDKELLRLVLPRIRADFELYDSHVRTNGDPFEFPITAFSAVNDRSAPQDSVCAWSAHTRSRFLHRAFEGDHFFVKDAAVPLFQAIGDDLRVYVGR